MALSLARSSVGEAPPGERRIMGRPDRGGFFAVYLLATPPILHRGRRVGHTVSGCGARGIRLSIPVLRRRDASGSGLTVPPWFRALARDGRKSSQPPVPSSLGSPSDLELAGCGPKRILRGRPPLTGLSNAMLSGSVLLYGVLPAPGGSRSRAIHRNHLVREPPGQRCRSLCEGSRCD